jgi:uncharacterized protein YcsI (UPF0317 family)
MNAIDKLSLTSTQSPLAVRHGCRNGSFSQPTAGYARGYVQANLVVLPADAASEFLSFCQRNPKPCPLVGMSDVGNPRIPELGDDLDVRTDVPLYRVWRHGEAVDEVADIRPFWREDMVAFAIGCSFSFEEALLDHGIPVRHIDLQTNVPMYRTSIMCAPAGRFSGPMVVSMRPMRPADAIRAVQVTSRFPAVHGAPVHIGMPEAIGIHDLSRPDYGDAVSIANDELPVFWACGVTPQAVVQAAGVEYAITHAPGHLLVTDIRNTSLSI